MTEQVHILRSAPEDVRRHYDKVIGENERTLSASWLRLFGKTLINGKFPKRISEVRDEAESTILVQKDIAREYSEKNLPALKFFARTEMEEVAKIPYDDGSHPHQKIYPENLPKQ